jgi:hypothetical protein
MWYVVLIFIDDIFRSDFMRSFMQFQHHNITSDKLSDQNNEKFYHVKQTVSFFSLYRTYVSLFYNAQHIIKQTKTKQSIIKLNKHSINLT